MKKVVQATSIIALVVGIGLVVGSTTFAADCTSAATCIGTGANTAGGSGQNGDLGGLIKTVVNTLLYVLGAAAVLMSVIGGIRYVTSQGDPAHIKSAKDTILYSVIGLIVAILAYALVNFVVTNVK
ncbi:hypothetical protein IPF89_04510 [Candidatus Saccharibacteria bacterium]|nr:MAG: hypothetical protein IPF89_04510 [Candidatus Saccharibacteria bacterium]